MLSPLDWAMVEAWKERGIPLRVAVKAIEEVFDRVDKQPNKARTIKSLSYCREEVEAQYEEWLSAQVGKTVAKESEESEDSDETEETETSNNEKTDSHLTSIIESLEQAKVDGDLRKLLNEVSDNLEKLTGASSDSETLEKSLGDLESKIDKALLENSDPKLLGDAKAKVEKELSGYKSKMEADVYERTFELMLLKNLREEALIPRLSLFQL